MELEDLVAASRPGAVTAALDANRDVLRTAAGGHHEGEHASVRTADHHGHEIVIRTTYEVTVDGQPFDAHFTVDNGGRVHYHGLPTRDFASLVDLVKKAIDKFPESFAPDGPPPDHDPEPGHHHHGEEH